MAPRQKHSPVPSLLDYLKKEKQNYSTNLVGMNSISSSFGTETISNLKSVLKLIFA
jgi:hypothetical protein